MHFRYRHGLSRLRKVLSASALCLASCTLAQADEIIDWNGTAMRAVATLGVGTGWQSRILAIVHGAMFDTLNNFEPHYEGYAYRLRPGPGLIKEAAVAAAASSLLYAFVPNDRARVERAFNEAMSKIPDGPAKTAGIAYGKDVANHYAELRKKDGADQSRQYSPGAGVGVWQATAPAFMAANVPHFGEVQPFTLFDVRQFMLPGPPPLDSPDYARDVLEVHRKGAHQGSSRSAEESEAAIFWNLLTSIPFNAHLRDLSKERKFSALENARLFALLHMVGADSQIATWYWKYHFNFWRPITAIRTPLQGGSNSLPSDPTWDSLIQAPNHPEYPSGHAAYGGAVSTLLATILGERAQKLELFNPFSGLTRYYRSYDQIAQEIVDARVWGGIHFRVSDEHGNQLGILIAKHALGNYMRPHFNIHVPSSK